MGTYNKDQYALFHLGTTRSERYRRSQEELSSVIKEERCSYLTTVADPLISLIYGQHHFSRLPTGDLSFYINPNTPDEVRSYILQHLMTDLHGQEVDKISVERLRETGINDDDIMFLTKSSNESRRDYLDRVQSYMESNKRIASSFNSADESKKQDG